MTLAHEDAVITWTEPEPIPLRATVIVLPGRGESASVYERLGRRLANDAYRVHALDDRTRAVEFLAKADPEKPRVVIGSDAGAAYAAHLAAAGALDGADALILAGLPTAAAAAPARDWEGELDARTSCPTHRGRISREGVRPGELFTDLPAAWFDPAVPTRIALPVLGLHGRADGISPLETARSWYAAVPRAELISVAGAPHDVLNDQTHRTVAASVVLFLERLRLGADLAPIAYTERTLP
ncbi:hypothetical protein [Actinoplanes sp. NPDC051851]|uniref:alpha/beta hydrolase n=1 Tax=Actinoplanes sp. NPDC051851 TaxID=3154753 RepID=UPI0034282B62